MKPTVYLTFLAFFTFIGIIIYNKGIEKDIFILECINADIINRKANGDLYHDREYIGITMEDCHKYMAKKSNENLYAKFKALLEVKKGFQEVKENPNKLDELIIEKCTDNQK